MENTSIIKIIQEMLQKGESEEKIFQTLKELGVKEEQVKNLLLMAKADTFTLLKSEIAKMTIENIKANLPEYEEKLQKSILEYNEKMFKELEKKVNQHLDKKMAEFEVKINDEIANLTKIVKNVEEVEEKEKEDLRLLDTKVEEKLLGSTKKIIILRIIAFVFGLAMAGLVAYKFLNLGIGASVDFLIYYIITAFVAATLLILSLI